MNIQNRPINVRIAHIRFLKEKRITVEPVTRPLSGIDVRIYATCFENVISGDLEWKYLALMPLRIRESILRYRRWQDRQATLFGKLLLLGALREQLHDYGIQRFNSLTVSRYGRPFIPGGPEFNISHSGSMVVLAVTHRGAVGIDIEKIRPVNLSDFSGQVPEIATLREIADPDHANLLFFDCWTRREAVLKGCGKGLMESLEHVVFRGDSASCCGTSWFIEKLLLNDGYSCHIATDQPWEHVEIERVNLMNGVL